MAYHRTAVFKVHDPSGRKLRRLKKMQRRYSSIYADVLWSLKGCGDETLSDLASANENVAGDYFAWLIGGQPMAGGRWRARCGAARAATLSSRAGWTILKCSVVATRQSISGWLRLIRERLWPRPPCGHASRKAAMQTSRNSRDKAVFERRRYDSILGFGGEASCFKVLRYGQGDESEKAGPARLSREEADINEEKDPGPTDSAAKQHQRHELKPVNGHRDAERVAGLLLVPGQGLVPEGHLRGEREH